MHYTTELKLFIRKIIVVQHFITKHLAILDHHIIFLHDLLEIFFAYFAIVHEPLK